MRESAARTAAQGGERDGRNGFLVSYTLYSMFSTDRPSVTNGISRSHSL